MLSLFRGFETRVNALSPLVVTGILIGFSMLQMVIAVVVFMYVHSISGDSWFVREVVVPSVSVALLVTAIFTFFSPLVLFGGYVWRKLRQYF
jgi:heme/copper-type cytochrome/quinol oxidase subunit 4